MNERETLIADLEHATKIAKDGENTPLVGGPIGLMWGILITAALGLQYVIMVQIIALPLQALNILWIGYAVLGGLGSAVLGRKIDKKAGAYSNANRVEQYVWIMFTAAMASLGVGVILNLILGKGGYDLWAFMVITGFAGQGLAYGVVAKLTGHSWVHFAAFAAFTMAAITMSFYGQNIIYLIAALGTVATVVIPSLLSMKAAR